MLSAEKIAELQEIAEANNGHCDRCNRVIKIYRYTANAALATLLRRMADHVHLTGKK